MSRIFIRVCAALIIFRSLTNFAKLFRGEEVVIVLFGRIVGADEVALPAVVVGLFMLVTGLAMWNGAKWAFPLIATYATYVIANLLLWTLRNPQELERVGRMFSSTTDPSELRWLGMLGFAGYCLVAIVTTAVPARILFEQRRTTN